LRTLRGVTGHLIGRRAALSTDLRIFVLLSVLLVLLLLLLLLLLLSVSVC